MKRRRSPASARIFSALIGPMPGIVRSGWKPTCPASPAWASRSISSRRWMRLRPYAITMWKKGLDYDWARDAEPIYTFLGIYVAAFQAMEGGSTRSWSWRAAGAHGLRRWTDSRGCRTRRRSRLQWPLRAKSHGSRGQAIPGWSVRIKALWGSLVAERLRRNGILHSSYMLRGVELGLDAIRTIERRSG